MIQLNLIEAASKTIDSEKKVRTPRVAVKTKKSNTKWMLRFSVLAAFLVFSIGLVKILGVPKPLHGVIPTKVLAIVGVQDPAQDVFNMSAKGKINLLDKQLESEKAVEAAQKALSLETVITDLNPSLFNKAKSNNYFSFLPLEQIAYQKEAIAQFLVFINTATPDNISFSDLVFEAPNYYYIRGIEETPATQRSFVDRLKSVSKAVKTPPHAENAPVTDISIFGEYNVNNVNIEHLKKFVLPTEVQEELKTFLALDKQKSLKFKGLDKGIIEEFGIYKKHSFDVTLNTDYAAFMSFIAELQKSELRVGIQKLKIEASQRNLVAKMQLVMYVAS